MMFPLVRELAVDSIPVAVTCRVLGFSKQAYFKWRARPVTDRDWDDAHLINRDRHPSRRPGVRLPVHRRRARRPRCQRQPQPGQPALHARADLVGALRKRGRYRLPGPPVHDDLVAGAFRAEAPNRVWFTDITEHPTAEGKLYLCAVKDACSNRIVGYSIDARMTSQLAVAAFRNALALRGAVGTIVHSDRGSQFRSHAYTGALRAAKLRGSIGRVSACSDNAAMESFFSLLQKNVLNRRRWQTRGELRLAIITWIERTYHRRRRQDTLGRLTPIEFETLLRTAHAA
jgi:transposase InsO family protein